MIREMVTEDDNRANTYAIEPQMSMAEENQFGFTQYAELLNGRMAMIGFVLSSH
jgi:Chlorophyll A-B binding protein